MLQHDYIGDIPISQSYQSLLHTDGINIMNGTGSIQSSLTIESLFTFDSVLKNFILSQNTDTGPYLMLAKDINNNSRLGIYKHNMLVVKEVDTLPANITAGSIVHYNGELYLGIEDTLPY